MEVVAQKDCSRVLDEMTAYICLRSHDAETSNFLSELKKEAADVHKRVSKMVILSVIKFKTRYYVYTSIVGRDI